MEFDSAHLYSDDILVERKITEGFVQHFSILSTVAPSKMLEVKINKKRRNKKRIYLYL